MSTAQKTLIDAIRRIALDPEALASALGALQKRGVIDGIKTTLGGYNELQDDCCTDGDGNPDDPSGEKDPIDEDAPPEVPDIGDDDGDGESDWSDCETGDPITFTPGGFPQPETCKDCSRPDPDWKQGWMWVVNGYLGTTARGAAEALFSDVYNQVGSTYTMIGYSLGDVTNETPSSVVYASGKMKVKRVDNETGQEYFAEFTIVSTHRACSPSELAGPDHPYCQLTEPPIIDDCADWEPDGTTNYTLADGCITASSCDPEASAQSQQCNECITICNEDGEERRVCAIGNGQWILYDPNGKYKGGRYDATGRRLEILPAGETGGYLPSERNPTGGGGYDGGTFGGGDGWVWN